MDKIKSHIDAAYAQLDRMVVGGDAKIPIGLAMAELTAAMVEIVEKEKQGEQQKEKQAGAGGARPQGSERAARERGKS